MIAVMVGLALFFSIQICTGVAIRAEWSPLRDPLYFDRLALLKKYPAFRPGPNPLPDKPVTVLFIGTSRTLHGVDAKAAATYLTGLVGRPVEVFNFGQAGAGPVTTAVYLRRLMQDGVKPDVVLVEVHPVYLAGQRPDAPETRWLLPFRLRPDELSIACEMGFPAPRPVTHGKRGLYAPLYDYRFLILDRYMPYLLMTDHRLNGGHEPDAYGFARLNEEVTPDVRAALLARVSPYHADYFPGYRPTGPGTIATRATLDQCRTAGWPAALVLMPESSEILGSYPSEGLRELDGLLANWSAEYRVPLFDARRWVPDPLIEDGHHLAGLGADLLTERLSREALAPWITRILGTQTRPAP
jgi:hypothetical protein